MVNKFMQIVLVALSLSLLLVVAISFSTAKVPSHEDTKQRPSRLTGYPTWYETVKGFDPNRDDAVQFLGITLMVITGIIGLKAVRNPPTNPKLTTYIFTVSDDNDNDSTGVPALGLNSILVLYNWATLLTVFASVIFDLGKVFSVIGVLHNASEIILLVLLGSGGKIKNSSFLGWLLVYIISVVTICVFLDFPGDAGFFKIQGLCMDFALIIEYIRIIITTKHHIREAGADTLPLTIDDEDNNDDHHHDHARKPQPIYPTALNHPNLLWLLVFAGGVHLIGNIVITFFNNEAKPLLLFGITYAVSFPVYMLYVFLDTYAPSILPQKRIYLPYTPKWKVIVITIISITLSATTIRIMLALGRR